MKVIITILLAGVTSIFMGACGGGGSSDPVEPITPTTVDPNGIWNGIQVINGISSDVQYIVYNNEIQGYIRAGFSFTGVSSISGDQFTANFNIHDTTIFGSVIGSGTASGTVIEQSSFEGNFSTSFEENGTLSLLFDDQYNNPSSLSYVEYDYAATYICDIAIDSSGVLSGSILSCSVTGNVTVPDPSVNIYEIVYMLSNCGTENEDMEGEYSGLGSIIYAPEFGAHVLQAGMSNGDTMTILRAEVPTPSTFK